MMNLLLAALTEAQVDQVLQLVREIFHAIGEGIKTLWVAISPILISYLLWRQSQNKREMLGSIEANTKISEEAFAAANNHNEKIAEAVKISKEVLESRKHDGP